ncbi:MAG: LPS translocon maturation chaperone LptM [Solirubrobacterales bacterium]
MIRTLTLLALVLSLSLSLAACGRKGKPIPPEGSIYPRHYPNVTFPEGGQPMPDVEPGRLPSEIEYE